MRRLRKNIYGIVLAIGMCVLAGCAKSSSSLVPNVEPQADISEESRIRQQEETDEGKNRKEPGTDSEKEDAECEVGSDERKALDTLPEPEAASEEVSYISPEGMTVESRIRQPDGYTRTAAEAGSFVEFLRTFPVKEDGSPVLLYDGREKGRQSVHAAVLELPIAAEDLQQCADSVMRMYAEYFYTSGQYDRIVFHFVNGFAAEYAKWRDGYRISVNGNQVSWVQSAGYDDSYETFEKYLRMVFAYAGTLSMEQETVEILPEEIQPGDVFLAGGSPGHVVMIIDVCENAQGQKAFLLAQGYMPAQEFHILINPAHENDPWYYVEELVYPFRTPEYMFQEGSLRRLNY